MIDFFARECSFAMVGDDVCTVRRCFATWADSSLGWSFADGGGGIRTGCGRTCC